TLEPADHPAIEIEGEGTGTLPRDTAHLAYQAALAVAARAEGGGAAGARAFRLRQQNQIPLSSGLGSSAAAIVGGAVAANALTGGRPDLLDEATQDRLHQPYRETLVPGLMEVFAAARRAGAYGVALSGSGPTVLAFGDAPEIGPAMAQAFRAAGAACRILHAEFDTDGAVVEPPA